MSEQQLQPTPNDVWFVVKPYTDDEAKFPLPLHLSECRELGMLLRNYPKKCLLVRGSYSNPEYGDPAHPASHKRLTKDEQLRTFAVVQQSGCVRLTLEKLNLSATGRHLKALFALPTLTHLTMWYMRWGSKEVFVDLPQNTVLRSLCIDNKKDGDLDDFAPLVRSLHNLTELHVCDSLEDTDYYYPLKEFFEAVANRPQLQTFKMSDSYEMTLPKVAVMLGTTKTLTELKLGLYYDGDSDETDMAVFCNKITSQTTLKSLEVEVHWLRDDGRRREVVLLRTIEANKTLTSLKFHGTRPFDKESCEQAMLRNRTLQRVSLPG